MTGTHCGEPPYKHVSFYMTSLNSQLLSGMGEECLCNRVTRIGLRKLTLV